MEKDTEFSGNRLVIAFKIEDEHGRDITPEMSNTVSTPLNKDASIDKREMTCILLAIRGFLFRAGGNDLIRHLFPECSHRAPVVLYSNDADKFRWQVSELWESRSQIIDLHNNS